MGIRACCYGPGLCVEFNYQVMKCSSSMTCHIAMLSNQLTFGKYDPFACDLSLHTVEPKRHPLKI